MRVEDISALKYCQNLMRASGDYVIYYKPHPLIIKNVNNHIRKSIGKTSINVIQDLKYQLFDIILSPLSSTSSILIQPNSAYKIYIYKNPKIFNILKVKAPAKHKRPNYFLILDEPDDLRLIKIIYKEFYHKNKNFSIDDIIDFLDKNPDIARINKNLERNKESLGIL